MRRLLPALFLASYLGCDCSKNAHVTENHGVFQLDSNELDFGPVTEFTQKSLAIHLRNNGKGPLGLTSVTIEPAGSDFALDGTLDEIAAQGAADLSVTFSPLGPGEDTAEVVIQSDDPDQVAVARVRLHGGPIFPSLDFDPDGGFLSFVPTSMALTQKYAVLRSVGGASLHVTSVGVAQTGNPDFSIVRPALPATLKPGESVPVEVDYSRSSRAEEGLMSVNSDDADAGRKTLRLIPYPAHQCEDGLDNDGDGLSDFPDDPGCSSPTGDDEFNDPECVEGAMRSCGTSTGACRPGAQVCHLGAFYPCDGGTRPMNESCNGSDDNCNGVTDEAVTALCTINGCMGAKLCVVDAGVPGGAFGACMPVATMAEACNGLDDNCDGQVDEGVIASCTINGCPGTKLCIPGGDGGFTACSPAAPTAEICDGIDNNCDGTIDNVMPTLQFCGFGVCRRSAPACMNGSVPACTPGMGTGEVCNGIDDDCDNVVDNGVAQLTCGSTGQCLNMVNACTADGGMNTCVPNMPTAEICDNVDNNCNTVKDEQADGGALSRACFTVTAAQRNVGLCKDGVQLCASGSYGAGCAGETLPTTESCNTLDDNCSGIADDETDAGPLTVICYDAGTAGTRGVGRCRDGFSRCAAGAYGQCQNQTGPIAEICGNAIDDDCANGADDGCVVDAGCTPTVWYQNHSYNPATGLPVFSTNMFFQREPVATKLVLTAGVFPLTITHIRFRGAVSGAANSVILQIRADNAGTPGAVLYSQLVPTSPAAYTTVPLTTPYVIPTQVPFWVGYQGTNSGFQTMTVYGDTAEATAGTNMCLNFTFGTWQTWATMGSPFTGIGDILVAVGQCP